MANVLEKIVADKRIEITQKKIDFPLSAFKNSLTKNTNSFYDALAAKGTSYIFECKKASPSKGLIRENFDLDEIAQAYTKEAACFSVLTDEKYFQGKYEYLPYIVKRVPQPCLNKDFFIEEYQVYLARYLGASAVLLMLSVLNNDEYLTLAKLAHSYNMDVLTEVSNLAETERALALGANIFGINNRNLRDLSTDLSTTEALVPIIRNDSRFQGVLISESGIYTHSDIQRLSPLVDGFLVGSALMAQENLPLAISQLVYGKVKVCGITSIEQAAMVSKFPVTYMGLIFAPQSKRFISLETAMEITHSINSAFIGVFVDQALEQVAEYARKLSLAAVQLHGNESKEYIETLSTLLPVTCTIIKAISVQGDANIEDQQEAKQTMLNNIAEYYAMYKQQLVSHLLLDCKIGHQTGGTGKSFDWQWLKQLEDKQCLILAGGISAQNAMEASLIGTGLIDLNSGLESKPGIKCEEKLTALFAQLRA